MSCTCEHRALSHQYMCVPGTNTGICLAPQCPCNAYEEASA